MSEKKSMFELLNERMTKEEIIKIVTSYDNKFNELEEENKQLKEQLQQKENIIKEVREYIEETCYYDELENYSNMTSDEVKELLKILDKEKDNV